MADKYGAITLVDECHAAGILGKTGRCVTTHKSTVHVSDCTTMCVICICRGTEEYIGIQGRVDIINSTLGKALGGAAGDQNTVGSPVTWRTMICCVQPCIK